jgi:crotonobetainyl-CoA:carnitine CoA-transferase CaiB-like acyl-CoA transferase
MRPGAIEALGLSYDQLAPEHPRLIFGEVSAFGRRGPDAARAGLDVIVQAASGLTLSGRAWDDGVPVGSEAFLTDYMAGMTLAFGITTALRERDRTGRGQKVSTSLLQASLALQTGTANVIDAVDGWKRDFVAARRQQGTSYESFLERRRQMGTNRWFYNTYTTRDGFIALGAPGNLRGRLMEIIGIDDPSVSDPNFRMPDDPRPMLDRLKNAAKEAIAGFTTADLLARCAEAGVPAAPLSFLEEVVLGEQATENAFVETFDHPVVGPITMPTVPVLFSQSDYRSAHTSAAYGEHAVEVLSELGLSDAEIEALVADRVVGTPATSPWE